MKARSINNCAATIFFIVALSFIVSSALVFGPTMTAVVDARCPIVGVKTDYRFVEANDFGMLASKDSYYVVDITYRSPKSMVTHTAVDVYDSAAAASAGAAMLNGTYVDCWYDTREPSRAAVSKQKIAGGAQLCFSLNVILFFVSAVAWLCSLRYAHLIATD